MANAAATKVEFYNGATKLGEDTTAPYSWTIAGIQRGTYSFTAKALVSSGNLTSSAVQVTAAQGPNQVPMVSLTSPTNNASFPTPATILIAANAADSDGSISKVVFYSGSTKLGEDATSPYQFSWASAGAGTYTLTAKAIDNLGATTTSASVMITVKPAPPTPPTNPTADLTGPDCVAKNAVQIYEVNASKLANATALSWWCTGSTQNITPGPSGKATYSFGPYFTGGQV